MRIAVWLALVLLALAVIPAFAPAAPGAVAKAPAVTVPPVVLPASMFRSAQPQCVRNSDAAPSPHALINLPAAGTGASATYQDTQMEGNTAVNATINAPSGASLGNSQNEFLVLGVGDPINATAFTAAGVAETGTILGILTVPVAYLANGTLIYNIGNTLSQGSTNTFAITWVHGYWWKFTYNGNPITGSTTTGTAIPWENGTYDLGARAAAGTLCMDGYTVGPTFVAIAYGSGTGTPTPSMPTTSVPWAVGVEPSGASGTTYVPAAANALPQLNTSLGVIGIQGHLQDATLGIDHIRVGSSVPFAGALASLWGNFKVLDLNHSSVTPVSASLAYNGHQIFNTTALDEHGVFLRGATYTWQYSPASMGTLNVSTGTTTTFTAGTTTASGHLWVNITYNCSRINNWVNLSVTPTGGPAITSFTALPSAFEIGGATFLNVTNAAWLRPITYSYVGLPASCASANVTSLKCTPTAPGVYPVRVYLNDSLGHSSNALATFTAYAVLAVSSLTFTPSTLTVNTSTTLATHSTGGVPLITYTYTGLPKGCPGGPQPATFSCDPNTTGTYTVTVYVNDSDGHSVSAQATITVNTPVAISAFSASPSAIPFGGTTFINVTARGGTPPYAYLFRSLPAGCTTASVTSLRCTPTASGSFLIRVNVTDSDGAKALGATPLTVNPPAKPVISSFTASPATLQVGWTTFLNVSAIGAAPLTYAYSALPAGCASSNSPSLTCTPTSAGTTTASVTVTDANSNTVSATVSITVNPNPSLPPTIASFAASPASIDAGWTTFLNVSASGGTAPLSYAYAGLPAGCTSSNTASLSCVPSVAGTYHVQVFVNDSAGHSVSATATLTVAAAPPSGSPSGSTSPSSSWLLYLVIAAVAAAVVIALLVVLRRRKGGAPPPAAWSPSPPPAQGTYGVPPEPTAGPSPPPAPPPKAW